MKIGLAQINTTVGDLEGNRSLIMDAYRQLSQAGADIVAFPELAVCGYPPRDLLLKRRFVSDAKASLERIASEIGETPTLIGCPLPSELTEGRPFVNAAALCHQGQVKRAAAKCLLPTYDVFDEDRYFQPAKEPAVFEVDGRRIAVTICEDIWTEAECDSSAHYGVSPVELLKGEKIDLHVNLSASPWNMGKNHVREELIKSTARALGCPLAYVNAIGGNDELIFDGRSMVANAEGKLISGLASFESGTRIVDTRESPSIHPGFRQELMGDIEQALVLGLRDYARKSGFKKAILGLSGGIDSALTAALAVEALGKENVTGISLPSSISSEHSKTDARDLAANLGIAFHTVPIADLVSVAETILAPTMEGKERDVTEENIQARARGLLLMALSNKFGALLLTTGNKSELAVGYCTLYGDMCGGLAVISDLPKTQVYELCRHMNRDREVIPVSTIEKPPSAELRPEQKDEDSLPPYEILDGILQGYVEEGKSSKELIEQGYDSDVVRDIIRKVDLNEYKRKQAAPGLKLTPLAFGVGRRMPIVQRYVS